MTISPELLQRLQNTHRNDDISYRLAQVIQTQSEITRAELSLADVMNLVTPRAQNLLGGTGASVELIEGDDIVARAVSGSMQDCLGLRVPRIGTVSGLCVERGKPQICTDAELDYYLDAASYRKAKVRSVVAVPLSYAGATLGVLKVMDSIPEAYSSEEATILQLMAGMIAASMVHAQAQSGNESQTARFVYQATHDSLTDLANRALVFDRLRYLFAQHRRHALGAGLIVLDIDNFRQINDAYGREHGDDVLRWIARRLSEDAREVDLTARLSADKFAIVLAPPIDRAGMVAAVRRLSETTRGRLEVEGRQIEVSTTVGGAVVSDSVSDPDALLAAAEQALYDDKRRARTASATSSP